ncbi:MAG: hypothetical protein ACD_16C00104G0002 [uncultured bacterium]|nr:MAG: hypothetical protein ACD_16C00104G0002 [uncultured bacterium]OFW70028.1 MAG: hypothetical protein A2X70_01830 [Alphaproteobacteria bacterium GWC2_42_16]OFW74494.1 MAG: hypothetical protein A2Z80_02040 [Alphaproteobacteria bacterium GWA2_41_27]OFW84693.1 MAG: hypothetical protein A3E50_05925 [Alphaproteobacteria bacterium RIFCSPHIGHO2_12_FULL_42_100]OFW85442.1 MAG: hypothetical protein A2W06_07145 [Alphaproteobacteria bacterium RBG_16_42_14]OFW90715.1 MAG: hypothetical protein A2W46_076
MARFCIAQIEYLSQELIDHMRNAHNLFGRGASELERAQKTLKMLVAVQDQWMGEIDLDSEQR